MGPKLSDLSRDNLIALYHSGATSTTIDGHTIAVDRRDIARILGDHFRNDPTAIANRQARPGLFVDQYMPFE